MRKSDVMVCASNSPSTWQKASCSPPHETRETLICDEDCFLLLGFFNLSAEFVFLVDLKD